MNKTVQNKLQIDSIIQNLQLSFLQRRRFPRSLLPRLGASVPGVVTTPESALLVRGLSSFVLAEPLFPAAASLGAGAPLVVGAVLSSAGAGVLAGGGGLSFPSSSSWSSPSLESSPPSAFPEGR